MSNRSIPFILLLFIVVSSCISRPDYVLDEDAMVSLLTDVHRSEGLLELQQTNPEFSSNEKYKQAVMAAVLVKHNVSRAQYDSSLVWYGQNLNNLVRVYNKVQKSIDEDIEYWENLNAASLEEFQISAVGDTVELWTVNNYHIFDETKLSSFRYWEIKSDSNYIAGDSIIWHLNIPHVPSSHYLVATLSFYYGENKTVDYYKTAVINKDTSVNISLSSDTSQVFNSIIASIGLLKDSTKVADSFSFVDSISMVRIHK